MPSFDVVSEIDKPELANATKQTLKELSTRFDFKYTDARAEYTDSCITMFADNKFQIKQADDELCNKFSKRRLELACVYYQKIEEIGGGKVCQIINLEEGINSELGRK